ncbi:unnamed protein product [Caenorhabditis angaria]|uniref:F-box domain-containing protein n=1 Tax=Caenorhabditis angaria TaxID=860376 RepID=A0A9P1INY0_9PELO|nr:unnamed protein product [Caenorhabditis angaria]
MASAAKKMKLEEKTGWFDMPHEMKIMIIDSMDIQTKRRFSRCSKGCYEEVEKSLNFIVEIEIVELERLVISNRSINFTIPM